MSDVSEWMSETIYSMSDVNGHMEQFFIFNETMRYKEEYEMFWFWTDH